MAEAKQEYVNVHGRKGGRGVRPWLLIPKVLCLAIFVGAYVAATVLWFYYRLGYSDGAVWPVRAVSVVFRGVIIPSLIATLLFGHRRRHRGTLPRQRADRRPPGSPDAGALRRS